MEATDQGRAESVVVDASNRLHCTLDCTGKVVSYHGWSLLEGHASDTSRSQPHIPELPPHRPGQLDTPGSSADAHWRSDRLFSRPKIACAILFLTKHVALLILRPILSYDTSLVDGCRQQVYRLVGAVMSDFSGTPYHEYEESDMVGSTCSFIIE